MASVSWITDSAGEKIIYLMLPNQVYAMSLEKAEEFARAILTTIAEIRLTTAEADGANSGPAA